jgi:hypothetical protein
MLVARLRGRCVGLGTDDRARRVCVAFQHQYFKRESGATGPRRRRIDVTYQRTDTRLFQRIAPDFGRRGILRDGDPHQLLSTPVVFAIQFVAPKPPNFCR